MDKVLRCIDCGDEFIFSAGEQLFFADKGLKNEPIAVSMVAYPQALPKERVEVTVKCALCAIETTVPFRATQGRPVYCRDCFLKIRGAGAGAHSSLAT